MSSRRSPTPLNPSDMRRDLATATVLLEEGEIDRKQIAQVYGRMREREGGELLERLIQSGLVPPERRSKLRDLAKKRALDPLSDREIRRIDRLFRRTARSQQKVDPAAIEQARAIQKQDAFRPLWEILPEIDAMEKVLARALENRCRTRYYRLAIVDLLGGRDALLDASVPKPGETIATYRLHREIGRSAMGIVYQAVPADQVNPVALRILPQGMSSRLIARQDQLEEIAQLRHKHIIAIQEVSFDHDIYYIVSDYYPARTIDRYTAEEQPSLDTRLSLVRDAARGLDFAHRKGILHQDLRPANLLVTSKPRGYVKDFGTFHLLGFEDDANTLPYRAPEQLSGPNDQITDRTDIYSLGVILYELVCDRLPFDADEEEPLIQAIVEATEPDPHGRLDEVEPALAEIVRRALHPRPEERTSSVSAMAHELTRYLNPGSRLELGPRSPGNVEPNPSRSASILSGFAIVLALLGACYFLWPFVEDSPDSRPDSEPQEAIDPAETVQTALERGRHALESGDLSAALTALDQGLVAAPRSPALLLLRARTHIERGEEEKALIDLERTVEFLPDNVEVHLLLAERYHRAHRLEEATAEADLAVLLDPAFLPAHFSRARLLAKRGERTQEAIDDLDALSQIHPTSGEVFFHLGLLRFARSEFDLARAHLERALELGVDPNHRAQIVQMLDSIEQQSE